MDLSTTSSTGRIWQDGTILHAENALVEEVNTSNGVNGSILISYGVLVQNNMIQVEVLQLNISQDTVIINQLGEALCLCDLRPGMRIDAIFSAAMTRSIPPQSMAFQIIVKTEAPLATSMTEDRVIGIDTRNQLLYTGNQNDPNDQMRFAVSKDTIILDRDGNPIPLRAIQPGQRVQIEHATFQTASIPPQTTAFRIQIL